MLEYRALSVKLNAEGILKGLLKQYPAEKMQVWPVNKFIGAGPELIKKSS